MKFHTPRVLTRAGALFCRRLSESPSSKDEIMLSGLSNDIIVRVVSCQQIVESIIRKRGLTSCASTVLADVLLGTLLMGGSLKDNDTLQINVIGTNSSALKSVTCILDGNFRVRARVSNPMFETMANLDNIDHIFGSGAQIQVIRFHPFYKQPISGIVQCQPGAVSFNLSQYVIESEQRECLIFTDIATHDKGCSHAVGVMMEALPNAQRSDLEKAVQNLKNIKSRGLLARCCPKERSERHNIDIVHKPENVNLHQILDHAFQGIGSYESWERIPQLSCTCGQHSVWRVLKALTKEDIHDILEKNEGPVSITCEFCGSSYFVPLADIRRDLLGPD